MEKEIIKKIAKENRKENMKTEKEWDWREPAEKGGDNVAEGNAQGAEEPFTEWQNKNEYNVEKVGWGEELVQKEDGEDSVA